MKNTLQPKYRSYPFFNDFDQFFNGFFAPEYHSNTTKPFHQAHVEESENHYLLSVDLPGVDKKDISIEVNNSILKITGQRKTPKIDFQYSYQIPDTVDSNLKIEAHHANGILEIALPKEVKQAPIQVEIKSDSNEGLFQRLLGKTEKKKEE